MVALQKACWCLSLRTGNLILGWLHLIISVIVIGACAAALVLLEKPDTEMPQGLSKKQIRDVLPILLIGACIGPFIAISHLYGTYKYRKSFLTPYLIAGGIHLGLILVLIVLSILVGDLAKAVSEVFSFLIGFYVYLIPLSFYQEIRDGRTPVEHAQVSMELQ